MTSISPLKYTYPLLNHFRCVDAQLNMVGLVMNFNVELLFIHLSACKWRNLNICDGLHIFSRKICYLRERETEIESFKALVPTEMADT